jgi:hypothetical protein
METIDHSAKCAVEGAALEDVLPAVIGIDNALPGAMQLFREPSQKKMGGGRITNMPIKF